MRSMGAHGKDELEQEFVGDRTLAILSPPELAANLAEFAGPVGQQYGSARILDQRSDAGGQTGSGQLRRRVGRLAETALRAIEAASQKPAASELVVARHV